MESEVSLAAGNRASSLTLTVMNRYVLNLKGIPYKTEWVEYPDIESRWKELGIPHTSLKPDGSPFYTVPAIHDPSTGVYLSESIDIAEYLDKTYPDTPCMFPHNTLGLLSPFNDLVGSYLAALWQFIVPVVCVRLNPASQGYFRTTREAIFGKNMDDVVPKGDLVTTEWAKVKEGMGKVDVLYSKTNGPYLMGDALSWGDVVVAAHLAFMRAIWGEDSQEWRDISSWHDGRWKRVVDDFEKYATVV
ncbi:hypothetical protein BDN70DRAFT_872912 [Pholiota conissans]|uniref:GST N-terminal domain-containing protein n=1 Tax=Pholiota conissans TaxID=109636 RepID=A0A9P6D620_9AGAR|nr:hypothetical protein BDN70DRAFT_872912 [Pholiota conissans]